MSHDFLSRVCILERQHALMNASFWSIARVFSAIVHMGTTRQKLAFVNAHEA